MLPLWVNYYGGQFGAENLYVVDDNSEDGSTDDLPCDVLHIPPIREASSTAPGWRSSATSAGRCCSSTTW